jgi:2'-5' RNA ligase
MRVFVAVELDEALRAKAARTADRLAEALGPGARRAVTWVAETNLHLTLRFLGEVDERVARQVQERIARPFSTPAFPLALGGLGAFPPAGPPRVLWLGVTEGGPGLLRLHEEIEARLDGLGFEREDRPFRAHLTIGRVKAPLGPSARRAIASVPAVDLGRCTIGRVTLFESRLTPRGPVYTAKAHGALGPPAGPAAGPAPEP